MIKFRAWDKDSKVMREIQHLVWAEDNLIAHCPPRGHEFSEWFTVILNGWEYQLMQSTGLKDLKGVEIFEGDVVAYDDYEFSYTAIVKKETYYFWLKGIEPDDAFHLEDISDEYDDTTDLTVIGNIYESPELLSS